MAETKKLVHKHKNVWWFWDETKKPRKRIGSYASRVGAETGLENWIKSIERQKKDKEYHDHNIDIMQELYQLSDSNIENECESCAD